MDDEQRGAALQAYRKCVGHSIARASRICEVGERIWRRWEKGEAPIPFAILKLYLTETGGTFIREEWE